MKIERILLWVEGLIILIPMCIAVIIAGLMSIGVMVMLIGDSEFITTVIPFIVCAAILFYLTKNLFGYLNSGLEYLKQDNWRVALGMYILASAFVVFGSLSVLFGGTRGWEQSIAQFWPGKHTIEYFALGLPAVLPAVHISFKTYKTNT